MSQVKFPAKRADGSFTVSARFSIPSPDTIEIVEARVAEWVRKKIADEHADLTHDLIGEPRVVGGGGNSIDVVFDGKPGAKRWKDWMVSVVQDLTSEVVGITFEGFYDLVANVPHPASLTSSRG